MMFRPVHRLLLLLLPVLPAGALAADAIVTERPSFAASTVTVGAGVQQLEIGAQRSFARDDVDAAPFALLRAGLGERTELQLGWQGLVRGDRAGRTRTDAADLTVALKHALSSASWGIDAAIVGTLSVPTGDGAASSGDVDPSVGFFWSPSAQPALFFGHVLSRSVGETRFGNSVGVGASLAPEVSAYLEYFGTASDGRSDHNANAGIAWTPAPNVQFDVYGGVGLDSDAGDGFLGFGFARRF